MLFNDKSRFDAAQKARAAKYKADHIANIENLKAIQAEIKQLEADINSIASKERGLAFDAIDLDKRIENLTAKRQRAFNDFGKGKCDRAHVSSTTDKLNDVIDERKEITELVRPLATQKGALIARKEQLEAKYIHDMSIVYSHLSDTVFTVDDKVKNIILRGYCCHSKTLAFICVLAML